MEADQKPWLPFLRHFNYENGNIKVQGFGLNPEELHQHHLKAVKLTLIRQCREQVRDKLKETIELLQNKEEQYSNHYLMKMGKKFRPYYTNNYLKHINVAISDAECAIQKFDEHCDSISVTEVWFDDFYELVENLKSASSAVIYQLDLLSQPLFCEVHIDAAGAISDA